MIPAALAVALSCLVGTAILGWRPSSIGGNSASRQLGGADPVALSARLQPPQAQPVPAPAGPQLVAQRFAPGAAPPPAPAHERTSRPVLVAAAEHQWCSNCGNIESVRTITTRDGSGPGAAAGTNAVVASPANGNMNAPAGYEIRVLLDDGTWRTFHQGSPPSWRPGARVRIVKGHLRPA